MHGKQKKTRRILKVKTWSYLGDGENLVLPWGWRMIWSKREEVKPVKFEELA